MIEELGARVADVQRDRADGGRVLCSHWLVYARKTSGLRSIHVPSDAIALAVRTEAPIFVDESPSWMFFHSRSQPSKTNV